MLNPGTNHNQKENQLIQDYHMKNNIQIILLPFVQYGLQVQINNNYDFEP